MHAVGSRTQRGRTPTAVPQIPPSQPSPSARTSLISCFVAALCQSFCLAMRTRLSTYLRGGRVVDAQVRAEGCRLSLRMQF